ncbi:DNA polymerase Y family protein [Chitinimonas sp.]|uniref:Y-family DNA polymerase n=1 Tax=Chitinimonas sp. TaxID=1934313 RepID=UPI0035B09768
MLWLALHFPHLPFEALSLPAAPDAEPWAVIEATGRIERIIACNSVALGAGIQPGQRCMTARAIASTLRIAPRAPGQEQALLQTLATWAGQFTPTVALDPPCGLLLEIGGCIQYFGGLDRIRCLVTEGLQALGIQASHGVAPTPLAASWLAHAGVSKPLRDEALLPRQLGKLRLCRLPWPAEQREALEKLGLHTLQQVLDLPRPGLGKRFGNDFLLMLDRALGRLPDPRKVFEPPDRFERHMELNWASDSIEALGFIAKRLLGELAAFLLGHGMGVLQVVFVLRHAAQEETRLEVGFGQPSRSSRTMLAVTRERMNRLVLPAPVAHMSLIADTLLELDGTTTDLFGSADQNADFELLMAKLRARLGDEAVAHLQSMPEHRPELAWRKTGRPEPSQVLPVGERPGWLLDLPKALEMRAGKLWYQEPLQLKEGPERIVAGWFDGKQASRDYYQAEGRSGRRYWVFLRRNEGIWYLHGLFA